jgi:AbrB family looped-hinge helix DNA binding protein
MKLETVKVDEKGRVIIPKSLREKAKVKERGYVKMKAEGKTIIIEPVESIADKYYGAFKIEKWPEDLDEFIVKVMRKWWTPKAT